MENQVKVEQVEVIEEKKKFFTKKKLIGLGVGALALVIGGIALAKRSKGGNEVNTDSAIDVSYESTTDDSVVE